MDWKQAISRNREALAVVVAGLVATVGQRLISPLVGEMSVLPTEGGENVDAKTPPSALSGISPTRGEIVCARPVYRAIYRVLRPAEAALRRLIVIVAATLRQKAGKRQEQSAENPLPDFAKFAHGEKRTSFRLIDPRKRFGQTDRPTGVNIGIPRISVPGLIDAVRPEKPENTFNAAALCRRIAALDHALKTLPRQARRLNRLMARRAKAEPGPGRVGPIRPGHPPGFRKRAVEPVDDILRNCHYLAQTSGFKPP